ncbi:MAG: response regulator transcription factor [Actinobacteria bacterium]|nr:response regulator transcription factor [Actinomycetota bacterium]
MRVVIAEDSLLLRDGIIRLLNDSGHEVVDSLSNATGLQESVAKHAPDLVILDVRMPPTHTDEGLRAAIALRKERVNFPVLVLSQYVEERYASELIAAGTSGLGYLLKERVADVHDFVDAAQRVADGETVLDAEVVSQLVARSRRKQPLTLLSPREHEVLALMAQGFTNTAIARTMTITEGAVEKHTSSIFMKLSLQPDENEHRRVLAVLMFLQGP